MKCFKALTILCLTVILASCSKHDYLKLKVNIDGLGTQSVYLTYFTRAGLRTVSMPVVDDYFEYTYVSEKPILFELTTSGGRLIGHLMAKNDQTVKANFKIGDTSAASVKGDEASRRLAQFCAANAGAIDTRDHLSLNRAIENYVNANPADVVSAILMSRYYDSSLDPDRAARLVAAIDVSARPASLLAGLNELVNIFPDTLHLLPPLSLYTVRDSATSFAPHDSIGLLLAFTPADSPAPRDSVVRRFNHIADSLKSRLSVVELIVTPDTARWQDIVRSAEAGYPVAWLPGGIASPDVRSLNIKMLPMIVLADSASNIIYRGPSLEDALNQF